MPVPRPTEAQYSRSVQTAILGTTYHALMVVGLQGLRGDWHRARAAGDFAAMIEAEARAAWMLAHARATLEALDEPPETVDAYLVAALWRADSQGDRYRSPPWSVLRTAVEERAVRRDHPMVWPPLPCPVTPDRPNPPSTRPGSRA